MQSFKKILKTVGLFLLMVILLSAAFITCYLKGENFHFQDARERDALAGKISVLFCGASNAMFGIQPEAINEALGVNSYNLSGALLTMRGRYTLLKLELERNPVHTVLLEVSPDTLLRHRDEEGPKGDLPILAKLNDSAARWDYFKEAFTVSEWPEVYYDMVSKGVESAAKLVTGRYTTENQILIKGFYEVTVPDKPLDRYDNYAEIYHIRTLPEDVDPEAELWLEKIAQLCKDNNATLFLVTVPQSKYFNCIHSNLDFFNDWFRNFAQAHGLTYYNFNLAKNKLEELPDETCFYDETHLNTHGGEIFTRLLMDIVNYTYQGRNNDFYFFNSYEELTWASNYFT